MSTVAKKVATVATRNGKLRRILSDEIMSANEEIYGKFRPTNPDSSADIMTLGQLQATNLNSKLDSLSLNSQDFQLFNNSTNTSEYFSLSLTQLGQAQPHLRLPEFGKDDILVRPNEGNSGLVGNWILLATSDEAWQRGTIPTNEPSTVVDPTSNTPRTNSEGVSMKIQRAVATLVRFVGPRKWTKDDT